LLNSSYLALAEFLRNNNVYLVFPCFRAFLICERSPFLPCSWGVFPGFVFPFFSEPGGHEALGFIVASRARPLNLFASLRPQGRLSPLIFTFLKETPFQRPSPQPRTGGLSLSFHSRERVARRILNLLVPAVSPGVLFPDRFLS